MILKTRPLWAYIRALELALGLSLRALARGAKGQDRALARQAIAAASRIRPPVCARRIKP